MSRAFVSAGANSQGHQCPPTMGTPWAANAPLHPGGHETADSQCVELELPFKMGHCAGICSGVKNRISPSGMDFSTEVKRTCGPF